MADAQPFVTGASAHGRGGRRRHARVEHDGVPVDQERRAARRARRQGLPHPRGGARSASSRSAPSTWRARSGEGTHRSRHRLDRGACGGDHRRRSADGRQGRPGAAARGRRGERRGEGARSWSPRRCASCGSAAASRPSGCSWGSATSGWSCARSRLPLLPEKELRASLGFQVQEFIPMAVDEAVLDYDPIGEFEQDDRTMLRMLLVAAQRSMVETVVAAATGAKLEPVGLDLVPFALVRSVGTTGVGMDLEDDGDEAVIDIGAHVTNIVVHARGTVRFVRILPSGGRDVTLAIARGIGVEDEVAERLKRGEDVEFEDPRARAGDSSERRPRRGRGREATRQDDRRPRVRPTSIALARSRCSAPGASSTRSARRSSSTRRRPRAPASPACWSPAAGPSSRASSTCCASASRSRSSRGACSARTLAALAVRGGPGRGRAGARRRRRARDPREGRVSQVNLLPPDIVQAQAHRRRTLGRDRGRRARARAGLRLLPDAERQARRRQRRDRGAERDERVDPGADRGEAAVRRPAGGSAGQAAAARAPPTRARCRSRRS